MQPNISIVIPTFNRACTILRTINSILNQTYQNFEIIVVDDGSEDNTIELLENIKDPRICIYRHSVNRGVTAAKNTGLNNINGEWFTIIDSDDEIVPDALETLINIPMNLNPRITSVSANCLDIAMNEFSGKGVNANQYLNEKIIIQECSGDFWGITKTDLLGKDRFNENLPGYEITLWYKLNSKAIIYYLHKPLLIYHTEGHDRISKRKNQIHQKSQIYKVLMEENLFLEKLKQYTPKRFFKLSVKGFLFLLLTKNKLEAKFWLSQIGKFNKFYHLLFGVFFFLPPFIIKLIITYLQRK